MATRAALLSAILAAGLLFSLRPAAAEVFPVIVKGKVTMPDGSPPPFSVGVERVCSDIQGSAPGPITNKNGEYTWRMDVDPMRTRSCVIRATHTGYTSTSIDISGLNGYTSTTTALDPIIITGQASDPYAILSKESGVPGGAAKPWKAAMKALDTSNFQEAATQMQAAVGAAPKFAIGWHALGVVDERLEKLTEARDAYQHAIDADPKMFAAYITLARLSIKMKNWEGAAKTADSLIKVDSKKSFPEIFLHQAVARYALKDLDGAAASAQEAMKARIPRAEYVYGRILEAQGDAAGAREHISKYLEVDKKAPDAPLIRARLDNLGKSAPGVSEPELLELPF